ncbi:MAG TPA: hypothetical protein VJ957_04890 [Longimicrobiales bacterium]|nr:hypothetical protein [Longimicrobiales bacterium]
MSTLFMIQAAAGSADKMTIGKLFGGLPTDPASIVVFVLVLVSIGLVIWAGRRTSHPSEPQEPTQDQSGS